METIQQRKGVSQEKHHCRMDVAVRRSFSVRAFTLIELLVVISIIGLLATLGVGLTAVASRKSKESRIKGDLNKLVTAIENYKAGLGFYPPDNPGKPSTNQLFYELSGTTYDQPGTRDGTFLLADGQLKITTAGVNNLFGSRGFSNSARPGEKPKFSEEFKPSQYKELGANQFVALIVPVKAPLTFTYNGIAMKLPLTTADKSEVNPWLYDSSSPVRNNKKGFDLWTEVIIGRDVIRFSNWEKDPVVLRRAP